MSDNQKVSGVRTQMYCRICGSANLAEFLDLGSQPLANSFLKEVDLDQPELVYPLRTVFCQDCNLVQLKDVVDPEIMFRDYVYFSSGMPASGHFRAYAESVAARFTNMPQDLVVEIGSNDGHFLAVVKETGVRVLGVDPAKNIAAGANTRGIETLPEFFSESIAKQIVQSHGQARAIVGNNVVAHIDNHHDLVHGVKTLLAPDGAFIFEAPYLVDMFENLTFDTIYHEHLSYLAVRPLLRLFAPYDLEIFDVQAHPIQGSSIRVFAGHKGRHAVAESVGQLVRQEEELKLNELASYQNLAREIIELKKEVVTTVQDLKKQRKRFAAYGAPAKGNTLLNYYGIGSDILEYATEELPSKIGLYTPGMHIPVVHVRQMRDNPPDYLLLLAWNYRTVAMEKEQEFRAKGGKFILPVYRERII